MLNISSVTVSGNSFPCFRSALWHFDWWVLGSRFAQVIETESDHNPSNPSYKPDQSSFGLLFDDFFRSFLFSDSKFVCITFPLSFSRIQTYFDYTHTHTLNLNFTITSTIHCIAYINAHYAMHCTAKSVWEEMMCVCVCVCDLKVF